MPKLRETSPKLTERLMVFIDGAYLRKTAKELMGSDNIGWISLRKFFIAKFNKLAEPFDANLIRIYYYDGIVPPRDVDYKKQKKYFDRIKNKKQFTVRLGEAVRDGEGGLRQKGVDILLTIDSLRKAYENHFEAAIILTGDRDFLPLIKALKDTGKKIFGFYLKKTTPLEVRVEFDVRYSLKKMDFRKFMG